MKRGSFSVSEFTLFPFIHGRWSFDDTNMERLRSMMVMNTPEDEMFNFDPKTIDWDDYFYKIHIPGVLKYVCKWRDLCCCFFTLFWGKLCSVSDTPCFFTKSPCSYICGGKLCFISTGCNQSQSHVISWQNLLNVLVNSSTIYEMLIKMCALCWPAATYLNSELVISACRVQWKGTVILAA